ncbi:hypothetical protein ACFY3U_02600 [Micromonospora sp. NPDC000089]|uniref:hypothetical protein n=1 Tax=unclassified Micromonospora TaxID=2617518 RepID=UPI0036A78407
MRWMRLAGLTLAGLAALLWAVGMTVLQPLTEPLGPWSERLAGNNTYWARDLRFLAILAAVIGLVLAAGGRRGGLLGAVLLGGAWVVADVALDRADLTGVPATVVLALAGCLAVAAAALPGLRAPSVGGPSRRRVSASDGRDRRSSAGDGRDRRVLCAAACVAAVLLLVAGLIESPSDREAELDPAAVGTGLLFLALTVGCALAAAPERTAARRRLAAGLTVLGVAGLVAVRAVAPGHRLFPLALLGAVLLTGVTLLAWEWPGGRPAWRRHALAAVVALVVPTALLLVTNVVSMLLKVGAPLTELAGNSPINVADEDVLWSLTGLVAGLGTALLLARPGPLGQRPVGGPPEPAPGPVGGSPVDAPRPASAERR